MVWYGYTVTIRKSNESSVVRLKTEETEVEVQPETGKNTRDGCKKRCDEPTKSVDEPNRSVDYALELGATCRLNEEFK